MFSKEELDQVEQSAKALVQEIQSNPAVAQELLALKQNVQQHYQDDERRSDVTP